MSARSRILTSFALAAAALAIVASAAHAAPPAPQGATVSDKLICVDGEGPKWLVSMANSGPNPVIDYTLHSDNFATVDYGVGPGPLVQRYMPANSGGSHLTVLADGAPMIDTTQSITCGSSEPTTTTTAPKPTTTTTTVAPGATSTTVASHANGNPSPTTVKAVVHTAATQDPPANQLPFTGSSSLPLGLTGSTLVLAGAGAIVSARRRKAQ
jgi:hypothetical protein